MILPTLELQLAYGRFAWGIVLAAAVIGLWSRRRQPPAQAVAVVLLASAALMWMPGPASAAYWLGLAFQWPSGLLVALCGLSLLAHSRRQPGGGALHPGLAATGAVAGGLLYLDASGWLSLGLYFGGFGPFGAPVVALSMAALCVAAIAMGRWRAQAAALLTALTLFMVLRLPTGNLWDALLDPFLWGWMVASLVRRWRHGRRRAHRTVVDAATNMS